jgi:hypothetical protein
MLAHTLMILIRRIDSLSIVGIPENLHTVSGTSTVGWSQTAASIRLYTNLCVKIVSPDLFPWRFGT